MKRTHLLVSLFAFGLLAACGSDSKGGDDGDDAPPIDAKIDAPPAPAMITITGMALERIATGTRPVVNATIAGYRNSDEATAVAMTTTDPQGMFTLRVTTGGEALDGYLKATATGLKDTYLYPPAPIAADTVAPINMVSESIMNILISLAGG